MREIVIKFISNIGVIFIIHKEGQYINKNKTANSKNKKYKTMNKEITNDAIQMANKHLKTCSNPLFIKGMQSKNWEYYTYL